MKKQYVIIAAAAVSVVAIIFAMLIGPSFSRLFINDEVAQESGIANPVISLSIDHVEVNKTSDNTAQVQTTFAAHNQGKNTVILDNVQYGVFIDNNTKIVSGSIGSETDDVIQGQASVYPVIAGDTLKVSDAQTLTRSAINNDAAWRDIINGRVNYIVQGIYTERDNSYLQAEGVQNNFELTYSPAQNTDNQTSSSSVTLLKSIQLTNVQGRIDHISIDLAGKRLFIAELGSNSVDVINLTLGKRIHTITGLSEPQGVLFVPKFNKIFISNGGDGRVGIYNASTYSLIKSTKLGSDADNIRFDSSSGLVYVGYGEGALAVLDPNGSHIGDISLPGHPESFQIGEAGSQIFVNVPSDHSIVVADKQTHSVVKKWQVGDASQNFPMASDEQNHRLFVGFRDPAKLVVYDTETGKAVSSLDISKDADDIYYDNSSKLIYVSAGEGVLDIFKQMDPDHYSALPSVSTAQGARTSLFVSDMHSLYVAAPERARGQGAEIFIYKTA
jgi:YVTN family beta-propeller protein